MSCILRAQHWGRLRNGPGKFAVPDADGGRVRERDGDVGGVVAEGGVGGAGAQQGEIAGFVESASVRGPAHGPVWVGDVAFACCPVAVGGLRCWRARGWPSVRRSREESAGTAVGYDAPPADAAAKVCGDDGDPGMDGAEVALGGEPGEVAGCFFEDGDENGGGEAGDVAAGPECAASWLDRMALGVVSRPLVSSLGFAC